jgi:hypothetical protein
MKTLLRLLPLLALGLLSLRAADLPAKASATEGDKLVTALRAADDERVAATKSGDRARLEAIFSNDLYYGHSSAKVDNKASYVESIVTRNTVYDSYDYVTREFKQVGPGIVFMTGRAKIKSHSPTSAVDNDLNFLAVWREENGKWRFLAWQSVKNPPPVPAAK